MSVVVCKYLLVHQETLLQYIKLAEMMSNVNEMITRKSSYPCKKNKKQKPNNFALTFQALQVHQSKDYYLWCKGIVGRKTAVNRPRIPASHWSGPIMKCTFC